MLVSSPRDTAAPPTSPLTKPPSCPLLTLSDSGGGGGIDVLAVATSTGDEDGPAPAAAPRPPPCAPSGSLLFLGDALPSSPFACLGPSGLVSVDSLWAAAATALETARSTGSGGLPPRAPTTTKRARSGSLGSSADLGDALAAATAAGVAAAAGADGGGAPPCTPAQPRKAGGRPPPAARAAVPVPPPPPSASSSFSPARLVAGWDALPTALPLPGIGHGAVITLSPGLWRAPAASGGGAVVTLAAKVRAGGGAAAAAGAAGAAVPEEESAPTAGAEDALCGVMFTLFHPRIVTTGVPGRAGSGEAAAAAAASATASGELSPTLPALAAPASVFASSSCPASSSPPRVRVLEVVLVRRPPGGRGPPLDLWHLARPPPGEDGLGGGGGALPGTPAWPGDWLIDVAARVGDGAGHTAWLRVPAPRRLPAA